MKYRTCCDVPDNQTKKLSTGWDMYYYECSECGRFIKFIETETD